MTSIIAHRGASRLEPENTVAAFERAAAVGADGVELDVRLTADGELVVHHDPHLADGRLIATVERAALPDDVVTLGAALDACAGMFVNVELKNIPDEPDFEPETALVSDVAHHLARRGADARWLVSCFHFGTLGRFRLVAPGIRTAWLTTDLNVRRIERAAAGGHTAIHPQVTSVTEGLVRQAHAAGLAVNVWTCNDADRLRELIAWGVDGICTDVPDLALAIRRSIVTC